MRDYQRFMLDWVNENSPDIMQYIQYEDSEPDNEKLPTYQEGYVFKEELQEAHLTKPLMKQRVRDSIVELTGRFIDEHSDALSEPGPVTIFTFNKKEVQPLYDIFSINDESILEIYKHVVDKTYFGKISKFFTTWITNSPHKLLIIGMAIEAVQKGYDDILECAEYLYAFSEYPILYRDYWKMGVNPEVMKYTCEHLPTKFKVKQVKNLKSLLKYDTTKTFEFYKDKMKIGADNTYIDILYRVRNQMNSKFRNISRYYYKNIENNATQHNRTSIFDDGTVADQEGIHSAMTLIIDKTINKVTTGEISSAMVRIAANRSSVDKGVLQGMMAQIYSAKDNMIGKFIEDVITHYFNKHPTDTELSAGEFLNYGLSLYKSINVSKDPILMDIKKITQHWYNDIVNIRSQYKQTNVTNYQRAIFESMILQINYVQ